MPTAPPSKETALIVVGHNAKKRSCQTAVITHLLGAALADELEVRPQLRLKWRSGHQTCEVIRADSRLFEESAAMASPASNAARMKLEWFRRAVAAPPNVQNGFRDIASPLFMMGISGCFFVEGGL